jgi:ribosome-binding factor A
MSSLRQEKVARLLQKDLSEIFQLDGRAMGIAQMISITVVRVAPDLGSARIYLSVFPAVEPQALLKKINEIAPQVRSKLAARVKNQLRKLPDLYFYIDDSYDYAQNIDSLLNK